MENSPEFNIFAVRIAVERKDILLFIWEIVSSTLLSLNSVLGILYSPYKVTV